MTARRARNFLGLGYTFDEVGEWGKEWRFWCNECERRLRLGVDDDGQPMVLEHYSREECDSIPGLRITVSPR